MIGNLLQLFQKDDKDVPDEESLVAEISKKVQASESVLQAFHRQWFVNIAMRRGIQYIQTHANAKAITVPPEAEDRVRIIANRMQGIHQTRLAKMVKDIPRLEVVPTSGDEDAKDLARRGSKMLDWVWQNERVVEKLVDTVSWSIDCGSSFLFVRWDPDKGPAIPKYQRHEGELTGKEEYKVDADGYILDEAGERIYEELTIGDVAIDALSPFDIINDQSSPDLERSKWIIIQQAMGLNEICTRWPERGKRVKAEKDIASRAYYQRRLLSLVGNQSEYFTPESAHDEDMATVRFFFERKCDKYPKGRMLVVANGVLLESGPMPFGDGSEYPIIKIDDIAVSGSFWALGSMENVVPIQKGYNRTLSQILENANNFGNIKLKAPKGHGMAKEAYDDSGDEFIEYNQGFEPNQLQPASLPAYVVQLLQIYDKNFEDVSGQHEVSQGRAPAGVKSGAALNALAEQDDTRLAPTKLRMLRALERLGVMILKLYEEFQDEDRQYQILGESVFDIEEITISKEEVQSLNKDVRCQTENLIAAHKRIQQEQVMDLYGAGVLGNKDDPRVRKKVLQLLEFGSINDLFDDVNVDVSQARRENDQFISGKGLSPRPDPTLPDPATGQPTLIMTLEAFAFEDHEVHNAEHDKFRKSPRYRQMTPAQRRGIDLHCEQHANFLNPQKPAPEAKGPVASPPPPPMRMPPGLPPNPMGSAGMPPVMGGQTVAPNAPPPPMPPITGPGLTTG